MEAAEAIRAAIRDIPDFPKPGIIFKDIAPVLSDPTVFRLAVGEFVARCRADAITKIAGIDARGFLFGAAAAYELGVGFVPVRKKGKLPYETISHAYALEYGEAEIEVHVDAVAPGERVAIVDDLLATGGTAAAAVALLQKLGATVTSAQFLVELTFLGGREVLAPTPVVSVVQY